MQDKTRNRLLEIFGTFTIASIAGFCLSLGNLAISRMGELPQDAFSGLFLWQAFGFALLAIIFFKFCFILTMKEKKAKGENEVPSRKWDYK